MGEGGGWKNQVRVLQRVGMTTKKIEISFKMKKRKLLKNVFIFW